MEEGEVKWDGYLKKIIEEIFKVNGIVRERNVLYDIMHMYECYVCTYVHLRTFTYMNECYVVCVYQLNYDWKKAEFSLLLTYMICIYECKCKCVVNIFYNDVYLPIFQIISLIKRKKRFRFVEIRYTSQISVDFNYKEQYYRKRKAS